MKALLLTCVLLLPIAAAAQTPTFVSATSGVAFTASPDHNTMLGTVPVVDHYELTVVAANNLGAIAFTHGLGKPTPDASNTITVRPIPELGTILPNVLFVATVTAVGPNDDRGVSAPSDPFARLGAPGVPGKPVIQK